MTLGILTNVSGLAAQRSLAESQKLMDTAMERLSTGQRINSASDDAAGLATSMRLDAQVRGLDMAVKNTIDGQAMIQTMESALSEVDSILQRMRELAVQSSNGTITTTDRSYIESEKDALIAEIDRIQAYSSFNDQKLFDGNLSTSFQVGAGKGETIAVTQGSIASGSLGANTIVGAPQSKPVADTDMPDNTVTLNEDLTITNNVTGASATTSAVDDESAKSVAVAVNAKTSETGVSATAQTLASLVVAADTNGLNLTVNGTAFAAAVNVTTTSYAALVDAFNGISGSTGVTATLKTGGTAIYLNDADGDDIQLTRTDSVATQVTVDLLKSDFTTAGLADGSLQSANINDNVRLMGFVEFTSSDSFTVASAGTPTLGYAASSTNSQASALSSTDLSTQTNAQTAIVTIDGAIEKIAAMRTSLGSIDNRLDHTQSNLMTVSEATSAARSKIVDADYATESANLAKAQVLTQAATAMLAQANAAPQQVLQLIQ